MPFKEYSDYDALGLAELVHNEEISAAEVLEAALARVQQHNPGLNAIIDFFPEEARRDLDNLNTDALFAGVPFLIKDLDTDVKGHATTHGSVLFKDQVAHSDCELVTRYRNNGLLIMGKTNAPEFGLNASTEGTLHGPCHNPWQLTHSTGGSSGGSAAAVAAGIVPMGHASDGGGSIRIPASCCGLFGLKPSRGMLSFAPHNEGWGGLDHMHVVTRSVRDSAALFDASAGFLPGDFHPVSAPGDCLQALEADPAALRIGFINTTPDGSALHPDCLAAVEHTAKLCEQLGHHVELASPDYDAMELAYHCALIGISHVRAAINRYLESSGKTLNENDLELATRFLLDVMKQATAADYATSLNYINQTSRRISDYYQQYDLWLTPTLAIPPQPLGYLECHGEDDIADFHERIRNFTPFTGMANATGLPAMSVPLHWTDEGLPVGLQFVGRACAEPTLFALAAQLERTQPWFERYQDIEL